MNLNKELINQDLNQLGRLIVGFVLMSIGITLNIRSGLGLSSWNIFHDGLSNVLPFSFGVVIQLVGLVVLLFSVVLLKTKVGPGTLLNILLVGFVIDVTKDVIMYAPDTVVVRGVFLIIGVLLMTFGRALYISTCLGPGPRDGLFVGLSRVTGIDVKYIKPAIEFTVLVIGFMLGGIFGLGTVLTILISGYLVQMFFGYFKFDPKKSVQRSFSQYILEKDTK